MELASTPRSSLASLPTPVMIHSSSRSTVTSSSSASRQGQPRSSPAQPQETSLPSSRESKTAQMSDDSAPSDVMDALRSVIGSSGAVAPQGQVSLLQQSLGQRPTQPARRTSVAGRPLPPPQAIPDDDGFDRDEDVLPAHDEKMAMKILTRALTMGSVSAWTQAQSFKAVRNKKEALVLAQAIDAFLKEVDPQQSVGLEILCRRLAAIHLADRTSNWNMANAIQLPTVADSLLPQADLSQAIRSAASLGRIEASLNRSQPSRRYNNRRGGGGGFSGGGGGGGGGFGGGFRRNVRGRGGGGAHRGGHQDNRRAAQDGAGASNQ